MAWRIDSSIIQGEFDFTIRGEVEGTLVVAGRAEPVLVRLTGVPWRDLAGHRLRFSRRVGLGEVVALAPGFAGDQSGSAGDMTASRKVKVPDRPLEELFHRSSDPAIQRTSPGAGKTAFISSGSAKKFEAARLAAESEPDCIEEDFTHPLVARSRAPGTRLNKEARTAGWIDDSASGEHPLEALADGIWFGSTKLAGALNGAPSDREWPPDPLLAGDTLVRLKKAREFFHDSLASARSAREDGLALPNWLGAAADEISALLAEVERLIAEARRVLE